MIPRFSHAFRSLKRAPLFTITVILALTIGLGSAAAIFAIVNGVLLRPLPYGHPDRLVGAWHDMPALSMHHAPVAVWARAWIEILRTLAAWTLKPKWRSMLGHRDAMWRGMTDFLRHRWGQMPADVGRA